MSGLTHATPATPLNHQTIGLLEQLLYIWQNAVQQIQQLLSAQFIRQQFLAVERKASTILLASVPNRTTRSELLEWAGTNGNGKSASVSRKLTCRIKEFSKWECSRILNVFSHWSELGVNGFRIDAISHLVENQHYCTANEPIDPDHTDLLPNEYHHLLCALNSARNYCFLCLYLFIFSHNETLNQPLGYTVASKWATLLKTVGRNLSKYIFTVAEAAGSIRTIGEMSLDCKGWP